MQNKKINTSILLSVSFLAAALGSTIVCALCMAMILFLCEDKTHAAQSVEAVVLSLVSSVVSRVIGVITMMVGLIPGYIFSSIVGSITGIITSLVSLAVFVIGIMAALKALKNEKVNIPVISGKFDGIFTEE